MATASRASRFGPGRSPRVVRRAMELTVADLVALDAYYRPEQPPTVPDSPELDQRVADLADVVKAVQALATAALKDLVTALLVQRAVTPNTLAAARVAAEVAAARREHETLLVELEEAVVDLSDAMMARDAVRRAFMLRSF